MRNSKYPLWLQLLSVGAVGIFFYGIIAGILWPVWYTQIGVPISLTLWWIIGTYADRLERNKNV